MESTGEVSSTREDNTSCHPKNARSTLVTTAHNASAAVALADAMSPVRNETELMDAMAHGNHGHAPDRPCVSTPEAPRGVMRDERLAKREILYHKRRRHRSRE